MAKAAGISSTTVHKLWAANDLKPHLTRTFKLSNDPQFEEKFWDVIGLYLAPSDKACVSNSIKSDWRFSRRSIKKRPSTSSSI
ncbi:ISPsy25 [Pseudomonas savastanoi pv. glycinea]|nr:ISPsy25 [Pseudomonas savastanoi pv. glycinea]